MGGVRGGLPLGLRDPGALRAGELRYEEALAGAARGGLGLAHLRDLSARRAEALCPPGGAGAGAGDASGDASGGGTRQGGGGEEGREGGVEAAGRYLSLLGGLAAQAGRLPEMKSHKNRLGQTREAVSWTSPLLDGPTSKRQYGLAGLPQEWGMACMLYAARLRDRGLEVLAGLEEESAEDAPPAGGAEQVGQEALAEAASWLRRASGAYRFCEVEPLPKIRMHLPGERPAEAMPSMADSMASLCLAEAQCLVATRAQQRGSAGPLVAALYMGASELFEEARNTLKKNVGDFNKLSERVMRYLAVSSAISTGRALCALAPEKKREEKLGEAVGLMQLALSKVQQTQVVCEICPEWRAECAAELHTLQTLTNRLEQENRIVHFQRVTPATDRALPSGKVLVKPIDFELPKEEKQAFF